MKLLLTITAIIEVLTGLTLIAVPSMVISVLLGASLDGAVAIVSARITGIALFSLAIICWQLRNNAAASIAAKGMLFYNTAVTFLLVYAAFGNKLSGFGLVPAVLTHIGLAVWCLVSLKSLKPK